MQPEHYNFDSALYLPVSEDTIRRVIESGNNFSLDLLSNAELAAILVLQNLPEIYQSNKNHASENILKKLISWGNDPTSLQDNRRLLSETKRLLDITKLSQGINLLPKSKIELLTQTSVLAQDYLQPTGEWDNTFRGRQFNRDRSYKHQLITPYNQELWLSTAQNMIVRTVQANTNEHLHIQGYAGVGKSFLISSLLNFFDLNKTIILVKNKDKLLEIKKRSHLKKFKIFTFEELALRLLSKQIDRSILNSTLQTKAINNAEISKALNISSVKKLNQNQVVSICIETIKSYCLSHDYALNDTHLPPLDNYLSSIDKTILLEYSIRIWQAIDPSQISLISLPFNGLSAVKKASLLGCTMPLSTSHVLIDESHDLPPSLLKILERGPQCLITFGDEYQRLSGKPTNRNQDIRKKEATQSVRTGRKMEGILNPLIFAHPSKLKSQFEGAKDTALNINFYDEKFVPEPPIVILVSSYWGLTIWFWSLIKRGHHINFVGDASNSVIKFASDCIYLFRDNIPSLHPELVHFPDWNMLSHSNSHNKYFRMFERKIQNGYNISDLNIDASKINPTTNRASYNISLVRDVGNMEFNSVLITTDLMPETPPRDGYELDQRVSTLYTAISRAQHEIFLPHDINEWLATYRLSGLYIPTKNNY